jgi:hypothetical protein
MVRQEKLASDIHVPALWRLRFLTCGASVLAGMFSLITGLYEHPSFCGVFLKLGPSCS